MKIIVTGGTGFIGFNLIKELIKNNEILSIDCINDINKQINNKNITYIKDYTWNIWKYKYFNADIIYHFGEYSRIERSFHDPLKVFELNIRGTTNILEYCKKYNIKLIYSGSSTLFHKDSNILAPYTWSKKKNCELINNYKLWFKFNNFTIIYFSNVYGENEISEGERATVIGKFLLLKKQNKPLTVDKPGTQKRAFTHINDTINGILIASKYTGDNFVITSDKQYSILEIAKYISNDIIMLEKTKCERFYSTKAPGEDKMKLLGFKPQHNLFDFLNTQLKIN